MSRRVKFGIVSWAIIAFVLISLEEWVLEMLSLSNTMLWTIRIISLVVFAIAGAFVGQWLERSDKDK